MLNIASLEGPILIAAMISFSLFGITSAQTVYYFRAYPGDHRFLKALVTVLFILDALHVACFVQVGFFYFIAGKMPLKEPATWVPALLATTDVVIISIVQSFYAWRVNCLIIGHKYQKPLVALILITCFGQMCAGLTGDIAEIVFPLLERTAPLSRISYLIYMILVLICDLTISTSLVYLFKKMNAEFKATQSAMHYLIVLSVGAGLLTSIITVCNLMAYYLAPQSLLFSLFSTINAKFYVNSMLVILNSRTRIQKMFKNMS